MAPWLTLDGDPYPVVVDGRIKWIVDGYTTSNNYPNAARTLLNEATNDSVTATTRSVAGAESGPDHLHPQLGQGHRRRVRRQ